MPRLFAVSLVVLLATSTVWAQDSPVFNQLEPIMPEFLENLRNRGEGIPDTTEPWRYFPLEVGNTWEYLDTEGRTLRRYIEKDTLIEDRIFFVFVGQNFAPSGQPLAFPTRRYLRFDTLTAYVMRPSVIGDVPHIHCPFDLPFGIETECEKDPTIIGGGYDQLLVFPRSDGNPDTVYTAVKTMTGSFDEGRFAADFGEIFHYCSECGFGYGLQAVRLGGWGGQVYGDLRFPPPVTSNEDWVSVSMENSLESWPNPFRSDLNVSFSLVQSSRVYLEILDLLGRTLLYEDLGFRAQGEHSVALHPAYFSSGTYLLRLVTEEGGATIRMITRMN